jgi:hypothetical protein
MRGLIVQITELDRELETLIIRLAASCWRCGTVIH